MIRHERRRKILAYLAEHEVLTVEGGVRLLASSPATVRRDFNDLARQSLVIRTHGGVGSARIDTGDMVPFWCREVQLAEEKSAIARESVALLKPNDIVMIDGGTSTRFIADHLPSIPLRLVTSSLHLAIAIDGRRSNDLAVEVFMTGGYLYPQSGLLIGPQAVAGISRYHANWALLSSAGISPDGLFNTNEFIAESERAMIDRADRVAVLADHTKIGGRSMCRVCGLDEVDFLITDKHPSSVFALKQLEGAGVKVVTVEPVPTSGYGSIHELRSNRAR